MPLVRSLVAKVSNNLQYCRSIRNRQSRELCTSLRNNTDGNSTKELRGVSVLSDLFRKGVGLAIEYGPYAALPLVGWYAHAYAIDDQATNETKSRVSKLATEVQDLKAFLEKSNKLADEKLAEKKEKLAEKKEKLAEKKEKLAEEKEKLAEEKEKLAEEKEKQRLKVIKFEAMRKKDELIMDNFEAIRKINNLIMDLLTKKQVEQEEVAKQHSRVKPVDQHLSAIEDSRTKHEMTKQQGGIEE